MDAHPGIRGRFEELLGLEVIELAEDLVRGRVRVRAQLTDAGGQIHGGVFAAIAHDLVGRATEGRRASVLSNQTSHRGQSLKERSVQSPGAGTAGAAPGYGRWR